MSGSVPYKQKETKMKEAKSIFAMIGASLSLIMVIGLITLACSSIKGCVDDNNAFWDKHDVLYVDYMEDSKIRSLYDDGWKCYDVEYGRMKLIRERKTGDE